MTKRGYSRLSGPLTTLAALAVLAALEGGARAVLGPAPAGELPANFRYAHVDILKPFFKPEPAEGGSRRFVSQRRPDIASFLMPKPAGVLRVFFVGGSIAEPFREELRTRFSRYLSAAVPGRPVEVVACGMGGYDSRRDRLVLEEVVNYAPDLVVVMSGNNEYFRVEVPHPELFIFHQLLLSSWLYRGLASVVAAALVGPRPLPVDADRTDAIFGENLRAMARTASARGVPLVFATLGANLLDSPPAYVQPQLSDRRYFDAWSAFERGDLASAEKSFGAFIASKPRDPFGHYYLALTLDRLGRRREAAAQYISAADDNSPGERTSPARNEIIRRVAAEEGAGVADLEKVFRSMADRGLPGRKLFKDACHWYDDYYPMVSFTILRTVYERDLASGAAWLAETGEWRWLWAKGLDRALRFPSIEAADRKQTFAEGVRSALAKALEMRPDYLCEQSVLDLSRHLEDDRVEFARLTSDAQALSAVYDNPWVKNVDGRKETGLAFAQLHVGEAYRRAGRLREALARFDAALALLRGYPEGRLRRALVLAQLGKVVDARTELDALVRERPDFAEARQWRSVLAAGGRP